MQIPPKLLLGQVWLLVVVHVAIPSGDSCSPKEAKRCPRRSKLVLHVFVQIGFVSPRAPCVSLLHPQSVPVPGSYKADAVTKDWYSIIPAARRRVVLLS